MEFLTLKLKGAAHDATGLTAAMDASDFGNLENGGVEREACGNIPALPPVYFYAGPHWLAAMAAKNQCIGRAQYDEKELL